MDAPKCRICGKKEWNHACSGAPNPATLLDPTPKRSQAQKKKPDPRVSQPGEMTVEQRLEDLEDRVFKLEKRKAYQREYMRKKRSEK